MTPRMLPSLCVLRATRPYHENATVRAGAGTRLLCLASPRRRVHEESRSIPAKLKTSSHLFHDYYIYRSAAAAATAATGVHRRAGRENAASQDLRRARGRPGGVAPPPVAVRLPPSGAEPSAPARHGPGGGRGSQVSHGDLPPCLVFHGVKSWCTQTGEMGCRKR